MHAYEVWMPKLLEFLWNGFAQQDSLEKRVVGISFKKKSKYAWGGEVFFSPNVNI